MDEKYGSVQESGNSKSRRGILRLFGIASVCLLVILLIIALWVKYNIYASPFKPAILTVKEQKALDSKMFMLTEPTKKEGRHSAVKDLESAEYLDPEMYTEEGARREISLSEKELNALIANNPEIAQRVAIDLSDGLVSVKLVIPVDEEIIFIGGKTIRLNMGIILGYDNDTPVVGVRGISLGGIPLPNAWIGYIKGKNLVEEFGSRTGFWKLFAEGVKDITVEEGHIRVRLKE